jgi:hypothetical protein
MQAKGRETLLSMQARGRETLLSMQAEGLETLLNMHRLRIAIATRVATALNDCRRGHKLGRAW